LKFILYKMPEATVAEVQAIIANFNFSSLMAGQPIDWNALMDKTTVMYMAVHCCINGPVGINKSTSFPGLPGNMTIKSKLPPGAANSGWKSLCRVVATAVNTSQPSLQCARKRAKGQLWPLYD
jgi:hypothetical protein